MATGVEQNTEGSDLCRRGAEDHPTTRPCACGLRLACVQHSAVPTEADQRHRQLSCEAANVWSRLTLKHSAEALLRRNVSCARMRSVCCTGAPRPSYTKEHASNYSAPCPPVLKLTAST